MNSRIKTDAALIAALMLWSTLATAQPSCVRPEAKNFVVATTRSNLADGWEGQWLLQNVETSDRIFLQTCSTAEPHCFYAVNVVPGKYFF